MRQILLSELMTKSNNLKKLKDKKEENHIKVNVRKTFLYKSPGNHLKQSFKPS